MRTSLLLLLFIVSGAISVEGSEQPGSTETESYTMRLKNNSDHMTLLRIGRTSIGASCDQVTDISTSERGPGKVMDLSCGPTRGGRYCISTAEANKSVEFSPWVQIDCTENFSSVLNLNLFGR